MFQKNITCVSVCTWCGQKYALEDVTLKLDLSEKTVFNELRSVSQDNR